MAVTPCGLYEASVQHISVMVGLAIVAPKMLPGEVLRFFEDGDWHPVREVACKFQITIQQAESVIELLEEGGFIRFDKRHSRAIIKVAIRRILSEIRDDEALFDRFLAT